jgi:hypothetical protein
MGNPSRGPHVVAVMAARLEGGLCWPQRPVVAKAQGRTSSL